MNILKEKQKYNYFNNKINMSKLSDNDLKNFKDLYFKYYSEELSDKETLKYRNSLLNYINFLSTKSLKVWDIVKINFSKLDKLI